MCNHKKGSQERKWWSLKIENSQPCAQTPLKQWLIRSYRSVCPEVSADNEVGSASLASALFFWFWLTRDSPSCNDAPSLWL